MKVINLKLDELQEAIWNSNQMEEPMLARLKESIRRYGIVENLVVRRSGIDTYEVLSGNQRLKVLKEAGFQSVPCVVVQLDDAHARLLAQALNAIRGEDDLGLRAELMRKVLETISEDEVLAILPETADSLNALASMGQETIAAYLKNWQQAQAARLKHLQFQLTPRQLEVIEEAIRRVLPQANPARGDSPNVRGTALFLLCQLYLKKEGL